LHELLHLHCSGLRQWSFFTSYSDKNSRYQIRSSNPDPAQLKPNEFRGSHFPSFVKVHYFHSINRNYFLFALEK